MTRINKTRRLLLFLAYSIMMLLASSIFCHQLLGQNLEENEIPAVPTKGPANGVPLVEQQKSLLANGAIELNETRNIYSRQYALSNGGKALLISSSPMHYKSKNGTYLPVDDSIVPTSAHEGYEFTNGSNSFSVYFPEKTDWDSDILSYGPTGSVLRLCGQGEIWHESSEGKRKILQKAKQSEGIPGENTIRYPERYSDVTEEFTVKYEGIKHSYIINQIPSFLDDHLTGTIEFQEIVTLPADSQLSVDGNIKTGDFITDLNINIINENGDSIGVFPEPWGHEGTDESFDPERDAELKLSYSVSFINEEKVQIAVSVPIDWMLAPERSYPITIDPSSYYYENHSYDDCFSWGSELFSYSTDYMRVGYHSDYGVPFYLAYMTWHNVDIPPGSTIDSVALYWRAYNDYNNTCSFRWQFEDTDDAQACAYEYPEGRDYVYHFNSNTSYSTTWTMGNWYHVVDFSAGLQDVIDRAGWASGNSVGMKWCARNASGGYRSIYSYDYSSSSAPYLYVEYTPPAMEHCYSCPTYDYGTYTPGTSYNTHSASFDEGGCRWYRFNLIAGNKYYFSMCEGGGSYSDDTILTLYDGSCDEVANNDDYCGTGSHIEYSPTSSGYYYLQIENYYDNTESYVLAYKRETNNSPNPPNFITVPSNGAYPTISYSVTADYTDPDGRSNVQYVYLRLAQADDQESYRQTMMWNLDDSPWLWSDETHYLYDVTASKTNITNGYRVTWDFKINWDWHESTNVDLWAWAYDYQDLEGSHTKRNINWTYDNDVRIYGSTENQDPVTEGDTYGVTGNVTFEGTTIVPSDWAGISVEMRKASVSGTLLDTDTSVSSGYSVSWSTDLNDIGTHDIYIVPKNTNHQPPNNSDIYWDKETVTVDPILAQTRFKGDLFINKDVNVGMPIKLEARLQNYAYLIWWNLEGETVYFEIYYDGQWHDIPDDGVESTSFVTDSDGIASVYYFVPNTLIPGSYTIRANYDGSSVYATTNRTASLGIDRARFTIAIYLDADNDLEAAGCHDFYDEISPAGVNQDVNLIVLFDRAQEDSADGYIGDYANQIGWHQTRFFIVTPEVNFYQIWTEQNMGDPNTLSYFFEHTFSTFPSDYRAVVLWNHGSGWKRALDELGVKSEIYQAKEQVQIPLSQDIENNLSILKMSVSKLSDEVSGPIKSICWDDSHANDSLTLSDLSSGFSSSGYTYDLVGFDACLMGMVEVAYQLESHGHIMVASEDSEWGDGWEYDKIVEHINGATSPTQLADIIVDEYETKYQGETDNATLSAWNLDDLDGLIDAINNLADTFLDNLYTIPLNDRMQIDFDAQDFCNDDCTYYDLGTIAHQITQHVSETDVISAAQNLINEINHSRRIEWWFEPGAYSNSDGMGGISIYFPLNYDERYSDPTVLQFANENWDEFVKTIWDLISPSCQITAPNSGGWHRGSVSCTANAVDENGIKYVEFQYSTNQTTWHQLPGPDSTDGKDWYGDNGWGLNFLTISTPVHGTINDGTVWVRARACDMAGNLSGWDECNVAFGVDNTDPSFGLWGNTDPKTGTYAMIQYITDSDSGVRDDAIYPRFYYRWNNNTIDESHNDGIAVGVWSGLYYEAEIEISSDHIGDTIYWRVRALDNVGNENWSDIHDGGVIEQDIWTLTVSSTSGGSVTTPGEGQFQYDHGSVISIVATADANYHFVNWTGTAVDAGKVANPNSASTTVTMDEDYTVQANFVADQHMLSISSTSGGSVTTPGEGQFQYDHGSVISIVATADANYHFVNWTGTAVDAGKVANPNSASTTVTMDEDYTVQANFAQNITRKALIALYNSTDGDNWTDNNGWKEPPLHTDGFAMPGTECSWYGITCDAGNTYVQGIDFYSNELTGSIPPELENLAHLHTLDLRYNQLTGSIPPELGNLTNMQSLTLDFNQLTGSIPPELGNLTNLKQLYLGSTQLTGSIPPELGALVSLEDLRLHSNQLTGSIPSELGNLTNLTRLLLHSNQLTGNIPPELGNLAHLEILYLNSNQLTGSIPTEMMNLSSLSILDICDNNLYAIDPGLRDFLDSLQPGWEDCQTAPYGKPMPWIPLLLLDE